MYVAPPSDPDWLLKEQRKLYERSQQEPDYVFCKLWGLITDPRNLRIAVERVASNQGRRTAGMDGLTVRQALACGVEVFVEALREDLRAQTYRPAPVRRVLIPKPRQPGKTRPLGIPTVRDRVVQAAVKNVLEAIFEADFYPVSYGFRPGKSAHGALEHLRMLMRPNETVTGRRPPYQWAIEGDIKGCFDNIDHDALMARLRRRVGDAKVTRLIRAFLTSGVLSEGQSLRTESGVPQGGILSPLLSNIALGVIEERYERHVWPRHAPTPLAEPKAIALRAEAERRKDRQRRRTVLFPIRYADDFIILVSAASGPGQDERARAEAEVEKNELAAFLKERLGLELSEQKTLVTPVTEPMMFLGHHVRVRPHPEHGRLVSTTLIPKERSGQFRERIKDLFRRKTLHRSLEAQLHILNPILRGWAFFYRHAWGAKTVFVALDHYVWWTIFRWLRKKYPRLKAGRLLARYRRRVEGAMVFADGMTSVFRMSTVTVEQFKLGWLRPPDFAVPSMESPVQSERCTPGSEGGARKPTR